MGLIAGPRRGRTEAPRAPAEIAETVALYGREHDRIATIEFAMGPNLWLVKISLKPNDPRLIRYQQGLAPEPPVETVALQEPNPNAGKTINGVRQGPFRALDIYQMGADGVRTFLERGNMLSGRGEHSSLEGAFRTADRINEEKRTNNRESAKAENRDRVREKRRRLADLLPANWRHHLLRNR